MTRRRARGAGALLACGVALTACAQTAAADTAPPSELVALGDSLRTPCRERLEVLATALARYERERGAPPLWLSDLREVGYVDDDNALRCPVTEKTGELPFLTFYFEDPRVAGSYLYEFCPMPVAPGASPGAEITMREWKMRQRRIVGGRVPMVRCLFHGDVLNIGADHTVFAGPLGWEDTIDDPVLRQAISMSPMANPDGSLSRLLGGPIGPIELPSATAQGSRLKMVLPRARPLLLAFFDTGYAPSVLLLEEVAASRDTHGADVWGIAGGDADAAVLRRLRRLRPRLPVGLDAQRALFERLGVAEVPQLVLIGRDGNVRAVERGVDSGTVQRVLARMPAPDTAADE